MDNKKLAKITPVPNNITYATVIYDLHIKLKRAQNKKEKIKIYSEFSQNYLMSKPLWKKRKFLQPFDEVYKEAVYHFYYSKYNDNIKKFYPKMIDDNHYFPFGRHKTLYAKNDPTIVKNWQKLLYPHNDIQQHLMWHEEFSSSPLPKGIFERINKMEKIYWKIKASEDNSEKWIQALQEANDHEFVKQNVEYRIGQNLSDKKLWKEYISYLRETDSKEMLQVYSKYCRFFLDDFEMKNEYKNATEKFGPVFVPWKNPFSFEKIISKNTNISKKVPKLKHRTEKKYSFECPKVNIQSLCQRCDLPLPLIRCMIDNARPSVMSKLQAICKYFYQKSSKIYCYRFLYDSNQLLDAFQFMEQSIFFNSNAKPNSSKVFENHKLAITTSFLFEGNPESLSLAQVIKTYIYECDAKYIHILSQHINEKDFIFLCGRGNVESFILEISHIFDFNEAPLKLENILEKLPNLREFYFHPSIGHFVNTSNQLSLLKFKNKFNYFRVHGINNLLDHKDFCTFVKKNANRDSSFYVWFDNDFDRTLIKSLEQTVNTMLEEWKLFPNKPKIQIV